MGFRLTGRRREFERGGAQTKAAFSSLKLCTVFFRRWIGLFYNYRVVASKTFTGVVGVKSEKTRETRPGLNPF